MKKYVIVGASARGLKMFAKPLCTELKPYAELVGVYDINPLRSKFLSEECGSVIIFEDFDKMLKQTIPDTVIVATTDCYHHEYIIKALEAGCDVITEKPMTIDAEKVKAILTAEKATGKKVTVTFNVRFMPYVARISELIKNGEIGEILNVDFEWFLDTDHGADYYRRWHRNMDNSGGMLVHKSTHHFDMLNWWIGELPKELFAFGNRRFYGPTRLEKGERCLTCNHKMTCEFYWNIESDRFNQKMYVEAEENDKYYRDRCVFAEDINIYDSMSVNVKYSKGTLLSYSLITHSPYEGWRASISGTKGRLEVEEILSGQKAKTPILSIRLYNRKGEVITYEIEKTSGGHGGGDERLRRMLFVGDIEDILGQQADSMAGAMAVLVGAGANLSILENRKVVIEDLLK